MYVLQTLYSLGLVWDSWDLTFFVLFYPKPVQHILTKTIVLSRSKNDNIQLYI